MVRTLIVIIVLVFSLPTTSFCKSLDSSGLAQEAKSSLDNDQYGETVTHICESDKIFAPSAGRYGINPSIAFSHGEQTSTVSISIAMEFFSMGIDQLSSIIGLAMNYATSSGSNVTSVVFLGGQRFYILKKGSAIPYIQAAAGLMHISSGGANATAGLFSPGVGLMVPVNNYITLNLDVSPMIAFNRSGSSFYIMTGFGVGVWF